MRDNMPKTDSYKELMQYFNSGQTKMLDATMVNEDFMLIQYKAIDEAVEQSPNTNVILAAFTTAHARTVLYNYMQHLTDPAKQLLYCDTDSIMYLSKGKPIKIGDSFGEMTDELPEIVAVEKIICCGPKFHQFYCIIGRDIKTGEPFCS